MINGTNYKNCKEFEFEWRLYALSTSEAIFGARTYSHITYSEESYHQNGFVDRAYKKNPYKRLPWVYYRFGYTVTNIRISNPLDVMLYI